MTIFAKRLKKVREEKKIKDPKWTQGYVSELLNIGRSTYTAYENGTKQPPLETVNKIADIFKVSIDYLNGRTNKNAELVLETDYDSLSEITKLAKEYKLDQFGFFDVEKWKNLSPEDVEEVKRHFEWVAQKAKERNEEK